MTKTKKDYGNIAGVKIIPTKSNVALVLNSKYYLEIKDPYFLNSFFKNPFDNFSGKNFYSLIETTDNLSVIQHADFVSIRNIKNPNITTEDTDCSQIINIRLSPSKDITICGPLHYYKNLIIHTKYPKLIDYISRHPCKVTYEKREEVHCISFHNENCISEFIALCDTMGIEISIKEYVYPLKQIYNIIFLLKKYYVALNTSK
jgi:hypothetical protein